MTATRKSDERSLEGATKLPDSDSYESFSKMHPLGDGFEVDVLLEFDHSIL